MVTPATARHRALAGYLEEVLGTAAVIQRSSIPERLPPFLRELYDLAEVALFGRTCLLLIARGKEELSPTQVEKHRQMLAGRHDDPVVYVADHMSAYQRKRLIERQVPFLVPQTQMYLPFLAIDLRERFDRPKTERARMRPATQAALIYWCYHGVSSAETPGILGKRLGYTKMSASRVFDELESLFREHDAFRVESVGRERRVRCSLGGRELWEAAEPFMRSPVTKRHTIFRSWLKDREKPPLAGLSALAERTQLMPPQEAVYAMTARQAGWRSKREPTRLGGGADEPVTLEIWRYNPMLHADRYEDWPTTADPLSVYLSLKKEDESPDERVGAALKDLVRSAPWR